MANFTIIDHHANTSSGLEAKMRLSGHTASILLPHSVEEVLTTIRLKRPDFIIINPLFSQADGFEIISCLKADNGLSSIPVFALVDSENMKANQRLEILGVDHYLYHDKLSIDELIFKIYKIIKNKNYAF